MLWGSLTRVERPHPTRRSFAGAVHDGSFRNLSSLVFLNTVDLLDLVLNTRPSNPVRCSGGKSPAFSKRSPLLVGGDSGRDRGGGVSRTAQIGVGYCGVVLRHFAILLAALRHREPTD